MDDEGYKGDEKGRPAPFTAADVGVLRPDDAVVICVPVLDVLLDNLKQSIRSGFFFARPIDVRFDFDGSLPSRCLLCHSASRGMRPTLPLQCQGFAEQIQLAVEKGSVLQSRAAQR